MDFSGILSAIDFTGVSVAIIAIYALMVVVAVVTWGAERVMALVGSGDGGGKDGDDYWDGYTLVDDARDRGLSAVYERAAAMAAAGEGQSDAYRDGEHAAARQMEKEYEYQAMSESRSAASMDAEEARYREMWAEQAAAK